MVRATGDLGIAVDMSWVASAWLLTDKHFRRIYGHEHLWSLAAILGREITSTKQENVA